MKESKNLNLETLWTLFSEMKRLYLTEARRSTTDSCCSTYISLPPCEVLQAMCPHLRRQLQKFLSTFCRQDHAEKKTRRLLFCLNHVLHSVVLYIGRLRTFERIRQITIISDAHWIEFLCGRGISVLCLNFFCVDLLDGTFVVLPFSFFSFLYISFSFYWRCFCQKHFFFFFFCRNCPKRGQAAISVTTQFSWSAHDPSSRSFSTTILDFVHFKSQAAQPNLEQPG